MDFAQLIQHTMTTESPIELQLSDILKAAYSSERPELFIKTLEKFIIKKEQEIEKYCNSNYKNFLLILNKIKNFRKESSILVNKLDSTRKFLKSYKIQQVDKKLEYIRIIRSTDSFKKLLSALEECQDLLELAEKIDHELKKPDDIDYLMLIRIAQVIKSDYIKNGMDYNFIKPLSLWIDKVIGIVESQAMKYINNWFEYIRTVSPDIGKTVLAYINNRFKKANLLYLDLAILDEDLNEDLSYKKYLDFVPLLKSYHLFYLMEKSPIFCNNFIKNRKLQANVIFKLQTSQSMMLNIDGNLTKFLKILLRDIIGFFVVEYHIINLPHKFYLEENSNNLWNNLSIKIEKIFIEVFQDQQLDKNELVDIKNLLNNFYKVAHSFKYSTSIINNILLSCLHQYSEILKIEMIIEIKQLFKNDYIKTNDQNVIEKLQTKFNFKFLKKHDFGFTYIVPKCIDLMVNYIDLIYEFLMSFVFKSEELYDIIRKYIDKFLINSIVQEMKTIYNPNDISNTIQTVVNLEYFAIAFNDIGKYFSIKTSNFDIVSSARLGTKDFIEEVLDDYKCKLLSIINIEKTFNDFPFNYNIKFVINEYDQSSPFERIQNFVIGNLISVKVWDNLSIGFILNFIKSLIAEISNLIKQQLLNDTVKNISLYSIKLLEYDFGTLVSTLVKNIDQIIHYKNEIKESCEMLQIINCIKTMKGVISKTNDYILKDSKIDTQLVLKIVKKLEIVNLNDDDMHITDIFNQWKI